MNIRTFSLNRGLLFLAVEVFHVLFGGLNFVFETQFLYFNTHAFKHIVNRVVSTCAVSGVVSKVVFFRVLLLSIVFNSTCRVIVKVVKGFVYALIVVAIFIAVEIFLIALFFGPEFLCIRAARARRS